MTQLCSICPRGCGVDRAGGQFGFCAVPDAPVVARAAPHFGEEPCISGTRGSGAVFFSGCNLRCVFCQNRTISRGEHGKEITVAQLGDIFLRLRDEGVHNINLVTPSHYTRQIAEALSGLELGIPVVWNSSGLRMRRDAAHARRARAGISAGPEIRPVGTGRALLRRGGLSAGRARRHSGDVPPDRAVPARR